MTRLHILILFSLMGGLSTLGIGIFSEQGFFIGLGFAIIGATLTGWRNGNKLSGGWAGAGAFGLILMLTLGVTLVFYSKNCEELAPGIFSLMSILSMGPAWVLGYTAGKVSGLTFPFPKSLPLFLGFLGVAISLLSAQWMSCGLDRSTMVTLTLSTYIIGWSGLSQSVRK